MCVVARARRVQLAGGVAHELEALHMERQGGVHLGAARRLLGAGLRQQQARLQVGEPGCHDQVVGSQLQPQLPRLADELQVLLGEVEDADVLQVDLLVARQLQQHVRSEEHTSELQSLMRISYAVFCLKKKNIIKINLNTT